MGETPIILTIGELHNGLISVSLLSCLALVALIKVYFFETGAAQMTGPALTIATIRIRLCWRVDLSENRADFKDIRV